MDNPRTNARALFAIATLVLLAIMSSTSSNSPSLYKIDSEGQFADVELLDQDGVPLDWPSLPARVSMLPDSSRGLLQFEDEDLFWIFEKEDGDLYQVDNLSLIDSEIFFDNTENAYARVRDESGHTRVARFDLAEPGNSALITPATHSVQSLAVTNDGIAYYGSGFTGDEQRIVTSEGDFYWLTDLVESELGGALPEFDSEWATASRVWRFNGDVIFLYSYAPLDYVGTQSALLRLSTHEG